MSTVEPGSILIVGKPLLDVTFVADEAFVTKELGLQANGVVDVAEAAYMEIYDATMAKYGSSAMKMPGGASQNTARTLQWLFGNRPGLVTYMGAIGDDTTGRLMQQKASETALNAVFQVVNGGRPTGRCLVLVNGKHRSCVALIGAANFFETSHLIQNWHCVETAKVVYVEGYFLLSSFEAGKKLAQEVAKCPDKTLVVNLSANFVVENLKARLVDLVGYADILIGNHQEALAFGRELGILEDLTEIAKAIVGLMEAKQVDKVKPKWVLITQGEKPVIFATSNRLAVKSIPVQLIRQEEAVDTNGAGDAFVAGLLAQLIRGKSFEEAIRSGIQTAAIVIRQLGCTFPAQTPDLDQLCQ